MGGLPNKFLAQSEFALVFSLLQVVPCSVDVGQHLAFARQVRLLVVGAHTTLQREEQHLQVALLHEPDKHKVNLLRSVLS